MTRAELARLRKIRHYLSLPGSLSRGDGVLAARNLLDEWIAEVAPLYVRVKKETQS